MNLTRSTPIPSHSFPDEGEVRECEDCGAEWDTTEYDDPPPWPCRRTPLDSGSGPAPVSDRREEKRSSSVTGERLVFQPQLMDWITGRPCFLSGWRGHRCEGRPGRASIEPAHLENRGRGYTDWIVTAGSILLNVCPACPAAHDWLDGQERPPEGVGRSELEEMAAMWVAQHTTECPVEVPEHYRLKRDGELV